MYMVKGALDIIVVYKKKNLTLQNLHAYKKNGNTCTLYVRV